LQGNTKTFLLERESFTKEKGTIKIFLLERESFTKENFNKEKVIL